MLQNNDHVSKSSDEELRKLLKPNPTIDDVIDILRCSYVPEPTNCVVVDSSSDRSGNNNNKSTTFNTSTYDNNVDDNDKNNYKVRIEIVSQIDSYDDCNYHVKLNDISYVLKIHNGVESNDYIQCFEAAGNDYYKVGYGYSVLHYQNAVLHTLTSHQIATNVIVPPFHNNHNSSPIAIHSLSVLSKEHSPCRLAVRLLTWVHGSPMSTISLLPLEAIAEAGRFLGRMDLAFDTMTGTSTVIDDSTTTSNDNNTTTSPPITTSSSSSLHDERSMLQQQQLLLHDPSIIQAGRRFHQWDGKNFLYVKSFIKYIPDEKHRTMIESIINEFETKISIPNILFRIGINQGDYNDANIVINPNDNYKVVGVIDFGDSVESWRILDLAVGMAYALLTTYGKANRSISAAAAMLRGYNSVYPLVSIEKEHLFLLMICRLATSCTLGAYSMYQNPNNTYLLLHSKPAWDALELLWGYTIDYRTQMSIAVNRIFTQACTEQQPPQHSNNINNSDNNNNINNNNNSIIYCTDLMFPDPSIIDYLQSVRTIDSTILFTEQEEKKRKHDGADNKT